jgi:multidrug efflux pump subunit AcrA (membrane-fusion protein)
MRRLRRCLVPLVIAAGLPGCGRSAPSPPETRTPPVSVTTTIARRDDVPRRFEAGGVVAAETSATVSSRVVAPVVEVRVRAGDRVRAGQVLIVLDERDLAAHARQSTASVEAAERGLAAARAERAAADAEQKAAAAWHTRIAALHARQSATAQELDEAAARLAGATARTEAAQARIDQATADAAAARAAADATSTTQSFATILSPFDGIVTERLTDPGNMAAPGAPLLRLDGDGALRVEVMVDEARAPHVRTGDDVEVLFEGREAPVPSRVIEIARAIATDRRAFVVKVSLPRRSDVRSGTFARVRFAGEPRSGLFVPASALVRQGQVTTAFVVDGDTARLRLVRIAEGHEKNVEVLAGLQPGEIVVVNPPPDLADGRAVRATPLATDGRP